MQIAASRLLKKAQSARHGVASGLRMLMYLQHATGTPLVATRRLSLSLLACLLSAPLHAQGISVNASLISEPQRHGLAEANGRPGIGINVDWELNDHVFLGVSGYITGDAPAPQRTQNLAPLIGIHVGDADSTQFDLILVHRIFPGDFAIDWDFTELQFDLGFTPNLGLSLTATDDYYGMGMRSLSGALEYVHNFSDRAYARVKAGHVDIDSNIIDSFSFGVANVGYRFDRFSVEAGFRANNAEPFAPFRDAQIRNRFMLTANWAVY